jgi:hypothetical protein
MFGNQLLDHHLSKTDRFKGALLSTHIQTLIACTGLTKKSANLADQGDHTSICSSHNDKIPIAQTPWKHYHMPAHIIINQQMTAFMDFM